MLTRYENSRFIDELYEKYEEDTKMMAYAEATYFPSDTSLVDSLFDWCYEEASIQLFGYAEGHKTIMTEEEFGYFHSMVMSDFYDPFTVRVISTMRQLRLSHFLFSEKRFEDLPITEVW